MPDQAPQSAPSIDPVAKLIDAIRETFLDQQRVLYDRNPPEGWTEDDGVDEPYDYEVMVRDALDIARLEVRVRG